MGRRIAAVVAGYAVMALLIFTTFSVAFLGIGVDGAFQPGTYEVSRLWLVTSFALGLLAAVAGGWVCARVGRTAPAVVALAAVTFVLGLVMAVVALGVPAGDIVRGADVTVMQAMQQARQPPWVAFVNPFVGAAGVLLGGRLGR